MLFVESVWWISIGYKEKTEITLSSHMKQEIGSFSLREKGSEGKLFPRLEG